MTQASPEKLLRGKVAIVTGAGQGLGAEIARHYVIAGANLVLCARTLDDVTGVAAELGPLCGNGQQVVPTAADVSRVADVDALVSLTLATFGSIDVLVNNAGIYGPLGALDEIDWPAWVDAVSINLLGTAYACRAVLPSMKRQRRGKIVNVSGGGATNPLPRITSYAAAKAAVVRFTESLALEVKNDGIDVNAVAPGVLATRLLDEVVAAGPAAVEPDFHDRMVKVKAQGGVPLNKAAALAVYLASSVSDGITGKLISAIWDPWPDLERHRRDLDETDIYTLRRIVPRDRGKDWGDASG